MPAPSRRKPAAALVGALLIATACSADPEARPGPSASAPVVLVTDLNHPFGDPDDHIDLAVAHGSDLDVVAVILDAKPELFGGDGVAPWRQMERITDSGWAMYENEAGTAGLLETLRSSAAPVTVVSVGSLSHIAGALRADADLVRRKVLRVVLVAGDAAPHADVETNVGLDDEAFLMVMTSGLPIRWVPAFDGGIWSAGTRSSFVQVAHADLFPAELADPLERYLSYRLLAATDDPLAWIEQPVTAEDRLVLGEGHRNLWAAGLMAQLVTGDGTIRHDDATVAVFEEIDVRFNERGQLDPAGAHGASVERLSVIDRVGFEAEMLTSTRRALLDVGRQ